MAVSFNNLGPVTTDVQIFTAEVLRRLQAYLGFLNYIRRDFKPGNFTAGNIVNIPQVIVSGGYHTRDIGEAAVADPMAAVNVPVKLGQVYKAVTVENLEETLSTVDLMTQAADQIAQILVEGIDASIWEHWWKIPFQVGHLDGGGAFDGSGAFNNTDKFGVMARAMKILNDNRAPRQGPFHLALNTSEAMNIKLIPEYSNAAAFGNAQGREMGTLPMMYGWNPVETHSIGDVTLSGAAVWGATPLVNNVAGYAIGTQVIAVDGLGVGTLTKGSIFKLGNFTYNLAADALIAGNAANLTLVEKLKEAVVNNQALTPYNHSAKVSMNIGLQPQAMVFATREEKPFRTGTGVGEVRVVDPETNLAFRMLFTSQVLGAAGAAFTESIIASMLVGSELVRAELSVRVPGSPAFA
jgi:hypothetical protein